MNDSKELAASVGALRLTEAWDSRRAEREPVPASPPGGQPVPAVEFARTEMEAIPVRPPTRVEGEAEEAGLAEGSAEAMTQMLTGIPLVGL